MLAFSKRALFSILIISTSTSTFREEEIDRKSMKGYRLARLPPRRSVLSVKTVESSSDNAGVAAVATSLGQQVQQSGQVMQRPRSGETADKAARTISSPFTWPFLQESYLRPISFRTRVEQHHDWRSYGVTAARRSLPSLRARANNLQADPTRARYIT